MFTSLLSSLLIAATFTTNVSADRLTVRLEEPIPAWTEAVMKIYSTHPITNVEGFYEKDEIKCVTDEQGAVCYISAINDLQGNFLSIGYDRNAVKEPVMFDFSSSDPAVKISPAILTMDAEGVFPNENSRTYQGEESVTLYPVSVTLEELQKLIDKKMEKETVEVTNEVIPTETFTTAETNEELTRDVNAEETIVEDTIKNNTMLTSGSVGLAVILIGIIVVLYLGKNSKKE